MYIESLMNINRNFVLELINFIYVECNFNLSNI